MKTLVLFSILCIAAFLTACTVYQDVDPQQAGWRAPALSTPDQWNRTVNVRSATAGPWAIVFFYPKADTPG